MGARGLVDGRLAAERGLRPGSVPDTKSAIPAPTAAASSLASALLYYDRLTTLGVASCRFEWRLESEHAMYHALQNNSINYVGIRALPSDISKAELAELKGIPAATFLNTTQQSTVQSRCNQQTQQMVAKGNGEGKAASDVDINTSSSRTVI